jgi:hypothetical protein
MNPDSWTLAANIAQVFASVSVIVAILFAIIQLREATRARYLEALTKIFEDFRSEEFFQDRRFVYSHDEFVYESCNDEEKRRVERLINAVVLSRERTASQEVDTRDVVWCVVSLMAEARIVCGSS